MDGILLKPFTPDDLREQVALASERKRTFSLLNRTHTRQSAVALDSHSTSISFATEAFRAFFRDRSNTEMLIRLGLRFDAT